MPLIECVCSQRFVLSHFETAHLFSNTLYLINRISNLVSCETVAGVNILPDLCPNLSDLLSIQSKLLMTKLITLKSEFTILFNKTFGMKVHLPFILPLWSFRRSAISSKQQLRCNRVTFQIVKLIISHAYNPSPLFRYLPLTTLGL